MKSSTRKLIGNLKALKSPYVQKNKGTAIRKILAKNLKRDYSIAKAHSNRLKSK